MLKVDISKAFDSLQWQFIQDMLRSLKFPPLFISWIMGWITGPWFTIKVNGANFGLVTNFDKTEVYLGSVTQSLKQEILSTIGLKEGVFPFRYLGIPIHHARLSQSMYEGLTLKITALLNRCSDKYLSYAGRLQARKMSFKSWSSICSPWSEGGFQLKNIASWNRAVLLKWLWHIDRGTGSVWSRWIRVILMLAIQGKLATIDLLSDRGLPLPNMCSLFRIAAESTHHLFFQCSFSRALLLNVAL
ncbi:uncharacterized protein LOC141590212 [Silene latifolia]|uniref:uncharacterized protein LOC141590212 n=1 Tax=Silene latifolia TaxID=37657 RepID=UPI003D76CE5F